MIQMASGSLTWTIIRVSSTASYLQLKLTASQNTKNMGVLQVVNITLLDS